MLRFVPPQITLRKLLWEFLKFLAICYLKTLPPMFTVVDDDDNVPEEEEDEVDNDEVDEVNTASDDEDHHQDIECVDSFIQPSAEKVPPKPSTSKGAFTIPKVKKTLCFSWCPF